MNSQSTIHAVQLSHALVPTIVDHELLFLTAPYSTPVFTMARLTIDELMVEPNNEGCASSFVTVNEYLAVPGETIGSSRGREADGDVVEHFFVEDDGRSLLPPSICRYAPSSRSTVSIWRAISTPSVHTTARLGETGTSIYLQPPGVSKRSLSILQNHSVTSVNTLPIDGALILELPQLCEMVANSQSLRRAEILTTECYTQKAGAGVLHRFLVLELRRVGRKNVWLRLDRRAGRTTLGLVRALGSTPAKDIAQLAADKRDLLGAGKLENRQCFSTLPTLGELQHFLRVICDELKDYQVWPANCWFFCSLVQQHLEGTNEGTFVEGVLPYRKLASGIRERVNERLRLFYHTPMPFSLTELLLSLKRSKRDEDTDVQIDNTIELVRKRDQQESAPTSRIHVRLGVALHNLAKRFYAMNQHDEAGNLLKQCVILFENLHKQEKRRNALNLAIALSSHSIYFHDMGNYEQACQTQERAITLLRELHKRQAEKHRVALADLLYNHGVSLQAMGRTADAAKASSEAIRIRRELYAHDPESHRADLASAVHSRAAYLHRARKFNDAVAAASEVVELRRQIQPPVVSIGSPPYSSLDISYTADIQITRMGLYVRRVSLLAYSAGNHLRRTSECAPEDCQGDLASSLCNLGAALHNAKRSAEACVANAEAVHILRELWDSGVDQYRGTLATSLRNYSLSLRAVGRFDEALAAEEERHTLLPYL